MEPELVQVSVEQLMKMSEEGAEELTNSPKMRPYLNYYKAAFKGESTEAALQAIADVPLQDRYLWRIASALKWAFADFDRVTAELDVRTMNNEDAKHVKGLILSRPLQFCLLVSLLMGEGWDLAMIKTIEDVRAITNSRK
jgi:hypothetical protein